MFNKRRLTYFCGVFLLALFLIVPRVLGVTQPYHQDEYKWAQIVDPQTRTAIHVPHPPLAEWTYQIGGRIFGYDNLHYVVALLSLIFIVCLYYFIRTQYSARAAFLGVILFVLNLYALIASLQIDIDGIFLPLFSLLTIWAYLLYLKKGKTRGVIALAIFAVIGGALTKLSYWLAPSAVILDLVYTYRTSLRAYILYIVRRKIFIFQAAGTILGTIILSIWFFHSRFWVYTTGFIHVSHRDFVELIALTIKSVLYASPLLIGAIFLGIAWFQRLRIWYIFLICNILFYDVIFDFTHRTMDRYYMFLIMPACIIGGFALNEIRTFDRPVKRKLVLVYVASVIIAIVANTVLHVPKNIIPLIPKSGFFAAAQSGHFGFLIPFVGGSGPLGFYLPADVLLWLWGCAVIAVIILLCKKVSHENKWAALCIFLVVGGLYNILGMTEFLTGHYFGSVPQVTRNVLAQVLQRSEITRVITYNDIGAYELTRSGKYFKRFYANEMFESTNKHKFSQYDGYYMVVNFPAINPTSSYAMYFKRCIVVYKTSDKDVDGYIYDCRGVPFEIK